MENKDDNQKASKDRGLFNAIAAEYTKKDVSPSARIAREMRLLQTLKRCKTAVGVDVLEVGCGAGFAAEYLTGMYRSYTGIDYSDELIRYARTIHERPNVVFHAGDFYTFSTKQRYDIVFMIGVLHHMTDLQRAIEKCCSLLTIGGWLVINEPQPANIVFHSLRRIRAIIDSSYSNEQEELEEKQIIVLFRQAGLTHVNSFAQGIFSTPFAEVIIKPQFLSKSLSLLACRADALLEKYPFSLLKKVSWNIIVQGCKEV